LSKYLSLVVGISILLTSLLLIPYISNIQALPVRDSKEMNFLIHRMPYTREMVKNY